MARDQTWLRVSSVLVSPFSTAASQVFQAPHDERRPARLMACADPAARVAVEVLVEEHQIAPVGVRLEPPVARVAGTSGRRPRGGRSRRASARSRATPPTGS